MCNNYIFASKGIEWYRNQMPESSPNEIVFEKTPNYYTQGQLNIYH